MSRVFMAVVVTLLGALVLGTALEANHARAQAVYTGSPQVLDGPMTVNGFVTMNSGMSVDGGVQTTTVRAQDVQTNSLTVDGGATFAGPASFAQRPTGIFLSGTLTRSAGLSLSVGCSTLGTLTILGTRPPDACVVSAIPTAALSLGITYDCYVTAPGSVIIRACALVSLVAAPAGDYKVVAIGPAP